MRHSVRMAGLIAVMALLNLCVIPNISATEAVSIQGRIAFPDGEVPVYANVTVSSDKDGKQVTADANGNYTISGLQNGTYNMIVFGDGRRNGSGMFKKTGIVLSGTTALPVVVDVVLSVDVGVLQQ